MKKFLLWIKFRYLKANLMVSALYMIASVLLKNNIGCCFLCFCIMQQIIILFICINRNFRNIQKNSTDILDCFCTLFLAMYILLNLYLNVFNDSKFILPLLVFLAINNIIRIIKSKTYKNQSVDNSMINQSADGSMIDPDKH